MDLPVEMLVHIFQFVGIHECVTEYTKTCNLWREVIALHILAPELERVAYIGDSKAFWKIKVGHKIAMILT